MNEDVDEKDNGFIFDDVTPYNGKKVRIAFIGDSITYGYKSEDPLAMSYPAQLEELLGSRYEIGNFGKNAAYVLAADDAYNIKSDQPELTYRNTAQYKDSLEFNADIIIIMLGTNDIRSIYPLKEAQAVFVESLCDLIDEYKELESVKEVYVATAIINHSKTDFIRAFSDGPLQELQKEAAKKSGVEVIDIYNQTKQDFQDISYYNEDNLHLNQRGYGVIASAFYEYFKK